MASKKGLNFKITPEQIMHTGISKSKNGYNSAGVHAKLGEKVFMSVTLEWESSETIPDFVLDLMSFMTAHKNEIEEAINGHTEEFAAIKNRVK